VPFRTVRENIEDYVGKQFVWGGFIARNRLTDEGTYLEVVQNPTNRYGRVVDTDMSEGRFLVFSKREMDPLIYEKGRVVTVAGTLKEAKTVTINGREYTYPWGVFSAEVELAVLVLPALLITPDGPPVAPRAFPCRVR
jgi:outer membrane lipoprotein